MACNCMTYLMERGIVLNKLKTGNIRFSLGSSYAIMSRNGDQPIEYEAKYCPICGKAYTLAPGEDSDNDINNWKIIDVPSGNRMKHSLAIKKKNDSATITLDYCRNEAVFTSICTINNPDIDEKERYRNLILFFEKYLKERYNINIVKVRCYRQWEVEKCGSMQYDIDHTYGNFCVLIIKELLK